MKKVLIISLEQFGYHTDPLKWCEYLRDDYKVTTITFDGEPKVHLDGVRNIYIPRLSSHALRGVLFLLVCLFYCMFSNAFVLVCIFPHCDILKRILPYKKMTLDIRTMDVSPEDSAREDADEVKRRYCRCYDRVTVISEGIARRLHLEDGHYDILPLGADIVCNVDKTFDKLHLMYVGTFTYREIDTTVKGFAKALTLLPDDADITYDLIGTGINSEEKYCESLASELGIKDRLCFHGYIQHSNLNGFFEKCNIGVSYVPIRDQYQHQPVTKTFEYGLSGLFTIASATYSNQSVINEVNGVLIEDNEDAFAQAIIDIYHRRMSFNSQKIRASFENYTWKKIINDVLKPIVEHDLA